VNYTDDVIGDVIHVHMGDVIGHVTDDVIGHVTGDVIGDVIGLHCSRTFDGDIWNYNTPVESE